MDREMACCKDPMLFIISPTFSACVTVVVVAVVVPVVLDAKVGDVDDDDVDDDDDVEDDPDTDRRTPSSSFFRVDASILSFRCDRYCSCC